MLIILLNYLICYLYELQEYPMLVEDMMVVESF